MGVLTDLVFHSLALDGGGAALGGQQLSTLCLQVSLFLSVGLSSGQSVFVCLQVSLFLSVCRSVCLCLQVSLSAGQSVFVCLCRSCLLYTSPSPRDGLKSRMPSSA